MRSVATTPEECGTFLPIAADPSIQPRLDSGALDQAAFVDLIP